MLTIHKNTKEQRRAKNIRRLFMKDAKAIKQIPNISGYSIVVWDADCTTNCAWQSTPPVMPALVVPEFSKQVLQRQMAQNDVSTIIDRVVFGE